MRSSLSRGLLVFRRARGTRSSQGLCSQPDLFPLAQPVQDVLNEQIGVEFDASLAYIGMAARLSSMDVSLRGAAAMFRANAEEESEHGQVLVRWLVSRGGLFKPRDINAPDVSGHVIGCAWDEVRAAVEAAITMERQVTESLLDVHRVARGCSDCVTADFISQTMLSDQVQALHFLGHLRTQLERVKDSPHGLNLVDEMLYHKFQE